MEFFLHSLFVRFYKLMEKWTKYSTHNASILFALDLCVSFYTKFPYSKSDTWNQPKCWTFKETCGIQSWVDKMISINLSLGSEKSYFLLMPFKPHNRTNFHLNSFFICRPSRFRSNYELNQSFRRHVWRLFFIFLIKLTQCDWSRNYATNEIIWKIFKILKEQITIFFVVQPNMRIPRMKLWSD